MAERNSDDSPLIVIVGETASGKSGLAMSLARQFKGQIISADSWAVYRGFNIGTAKPTKQDTVEIPHYLINVADPKKGFSAAGFKKLASDAIKKISEQKQLPIVVGGTGLYIDSLLYDYGFLPAGPKEKREKLEELTIEQLISELKARQISLEGIDTRNKRRLVRLLEVGGQRPSKRPIRPNTLVLGLTVPREQLKQQVIKRVDAQIKSGLEAEVKELAGKYGWDVEPMKGIGYQQWREYFDGNQSAEQTRERIISSTMQLAKKQRTWFKRNNSIHWIANLTEAEYLVKDFLNK
jgi:tRNA dimethylallyltransferase